MFAALVGGDRGGVHAGHGAVHLPAAAPAAPHVVVFAPPVPPAAFDLVIDDDDEPCHHHRSDFQGTSKYFLLQRCSDCRHVMFTARKPQHVPLPIMG